MQTPSESLHDVYKKVRAFDDSVFDAAGIDASNYPDRFSVHAKAQVLIMNAVHDRTEPLGAIHHWLISHPIKS